jgi:hypothetical protein
MNLRIRIPETTGELTLSYASESQIIRITDERTLVSLWDTSDQTAKEMKKLLEAYKFHK